jgi:hypothetical protein
MERDRDGGRRGRPETPYALSVSPKKDPTFFASIYLRPFFFLSVLTNV